MAEDNHSWSFCVQRSFTSSSAGKKLVKLGFVGAGGINFGTPGNRNVHEFSLESHSHMMCGLLCQNRMRRNLVKVGPLLQVSSTHKCRRPGLIKPCKKRLPDHQRAHIKVCVHCCRGPMESRCKAGEVSR